MTLNSFRINYRFVTYSGKLCSVMLDAQEPLTSFELVILEYQPTKARFQITTVPAGG